MSRINKQGGVRIQFYLAPHNVAYLRKMSKELEQPMSKSINLLLDLLRESDSSPFITIIEKVLNKMINKT
jgi:hypothetical protein